MCEKKKSVKIENDYNFPLFFPQKYFFFFYLVDWRNRRNFFFYLVKFLFDMIHKFSSSLMRNLFGKLVK